MNDLSTQIPAIDLDAVTNPIASSRGMPGACLHRSPAIRI